MATQSFYDQIGSNKRQSFLLAALVVLVLGALGYVIGFAISGSPSGAVVVTVLAIGLGALSGVATYFGGDKLVLTASQARPVDEAIDHGLLKARANVLGPMVAGRDRALNGALEPGEGEMRLARADQWSW